MSSIAERTLLDYSLRTAPSPTSQLHLQIYVIGIRTNGFGKRYHFTALLRHIITAPPPASCIRIVINVAAQRFGQSGHHQPSGADDIIFFFGISLDFCGFPAGNFQIF
jgi:hypothetical protein